MKIETARRVAKLYRDLERYTEHLKFLKRDGMQETKHFRFFGVELSEGVRKVITEMTIYEWEKKVESIKKELETIGGAE